MECNRDEAVRSRCIAEQKFLQHDVLGARKFALKAQYLFPDLEGLPQLLAVLDVHSVAQQKIDGADVNWYGILQTDASADDMTIRKQYRKLALILHPDKNKAIGAEAAFKLISEARRVLSDKEKKAAHDARRSSSNGFGFAARKPMRGFYNFSRFNGFCQPTPADGLKKSFWTGCPSCKMQFEFMRVHENKKIPCPTCSKVFRATEMQEPNPSFRAQPPERSSWAARRGCPEKQGQKDGGSRAHVSSSHSFHWGPHKFDASKYANAAAQMVQQTYEAVRKERIKAQKEAREKAAKARMEVEIELMKREHKERKQKRKEQREMANEGHVHRCSQEGDASARFSSGAESGRVHSGTFMATEEVARENVHMSSLHASSSVKESVSCVGGKAVRLEQMQEPFWCRGRNGFDSTNSHDSSDMFTFSKRLKVDV